MRNRSSKQQGNNKGGLEVEKLSKLKQEPHLSGAYIRSLVKQLTSSRTKDPMNPKAFDCADGDVLSPQNLRKFSEGFVETPRTHHPQQSQQPKKQVRRRLHTSRPYQERLLNMAEARREIVTALKFHRASMKQANEQQQQQEEQSQSLQPSPAPSSLPSLDQKERMNSRRNPMIYPSNYLENLSYSSFSCPPPNPFPWTSSIAPLPINETFNLSLPNQPLGLNLNFHDFNNIDTTLYHHNHSNPSIYLYPSPSSSSSPSSTEESHPVMIAPEESQMNVIDCGVTNGGLHPAMDDEEMAEIRSIGEQHQMEWNDKLNLYTSAWWFKFLREENGEDDGFHLFDEVMEFPAWMNANESLQQHLDDYYSKDYLQEPALPCMDIGEIEGMDVEWLA